MADLPKTQAPAPPNFYSNAAAMSGGGAQPAAKKPAAAAGGTNPDQEFLANVTKLLKVLDQLGEMKPKGKHITKFTQAAADAMQEALKSVYGDDTGEQVPGADTQAGDAGVDAGAGQGGAPGSSCPV